jgi:hypothetical protein
MSTSMAKKKRLKQAREGKRSPELQRLSWNGIHPASRITPTRSELTVRQTNKHKGKWNPNRNHGDDSIFRLGPRSRLSLFALIKEHSIL